MFTGRSKQSSGQEEELLLEEHIQELSYQQSHTFEGAAACRKAASEGRIPHWTGFCVKGKSDKYATGPLWKIV